MIRLKQHYIYIPVYTQHCADEPGSPTVFSLVVGVAVSVIVVVIAVVYIAAFVIWLR